MATNPFSLSFGIEPESFISRFKESSEIENAFTSENPVSYAYMITGVRGSGKTVMLSNLSERFEKKEGWIVIGVTPDSDILNSVAAKLYSRNELKKLFIKAKLDLSAFGLGVSIERGNQIFDIETALERMLEELKKMDKKVLIMIDEIAGNEFVKPFISVFQLLIRKRLPVFLIMTGLYENIYNLQNEKTLTFLYRAPKVVMEPLGIGAVSRSYAQIFRIDSDDAMNMAKLTKGYAFAYQALGYLFWEARSKNKDCTYETVISQYDDVLESYVYEKIWSELSPREKMIVSMLVKKDNAKVSDLRDELGESSSSFSVYRDRLKKKGVIDTTTYGVISLKLPRFGDIAKAWID